MHWMDTQVMQESMDPLCVAHLHSLTMAFFCHDQICQSTWNGILSIVLRRGGTMLVLSGSNSTLHRNQIQHYIRIKFNITLKKNHPILREELKMNEVKVFLEVNDSKRKFDRKTWTCENSHSIRVVLNSMQVTCQIYPLNLLKIYTSVICKVFFFRILKKMTFSKLQSNYFHAVLFCLITPFNLKNNCDSIYCGTFHDERQVRTVRIDSQLISGFHQMKGIELTQMRKFLPSLHIYVFFQNVWYTPKKLV